MAGNEQSRTFVYVVDAKGEPEMVWLADAERIAWPAEMGGSVPTAMMEIVSLDADNVRVDSVVKDLEPVAIYRLPDGRCVMEAKASDRTHFVWIARALWDRYKSTIEVRKAAHQRPESVDSVHPPSPVSVSAFSGGGRNQSTCAIGVMPTLSFTTTTIVLLATSACTGQRTPAQRGSTRRTGAVGAPTCRAVLSASDTI